MLSLNVQEPEKRTPRDDGSLDLQEVFPTIQGEGPYVGSPAIFVRTAGCTLQCGLCLYGDSQIRMADFSVKPISAVREGDEVLSYSEEEGRFVPKPVTAVMRREIKEIYRVDTGGNKHLYATGEHPVLVKDRGWTQVKDLQTGDTIIHLSLSELRRLHNPMKNPQSVAKMAATKEAAGTLRVSPYAYMSTSRRDEHREKTRARMTAANPMKNPEVAVRSYTNRKTRPMTGPEKFVAAIGAELGLAYVGGGELVVGHKVPDFIFPGTKKLVEVWDSSQTEYRGRDEEWKQQRRKVLEEAGYKVLFLPVTPYPLDDTVGSRKPERREARDAEVKRVRATLGKYLYNGAIVKRLDRISPGRNSKSYARLAGDLRTPMPVYNLEVADTHTYVANGLVVHNCDTDYTSKRKLYTVQRLVEEVQRLTPSKLYKPLVVVTGGEPFRQDCGQVVGALVISGYKVQFETNGTVYDPSMEDWYLSPMVTIVCSPKTPKIHDKLKPHISALKYVLKAGQVDVDGLPTSSLLQGVRPCRPWESFDGTIYVQPVDEDDPVLNAANVQAVLESCREFGYLFCPQVHKVFNLP